MRASVSLYYCHRFPTEIISHWVRLYFGFALSLRAVEEMLAMRGVSLSYETVREWCLKFGKSYANGVRRKCICVAHRRTIEGQIFPKVSNRRAWEFQSHGRTEA